MGFILGVPFVLDFSELLSRVFCTESEMALRVVWLAFCRDGEITIDPYWKLCRDCIPSANKVPATWCNSGSPFGYSPAFALHATISDTNLFFVGSLGGNALNSANNFPVVLVRVLNLPIASLHVLAWLPAQQQSRTHLSRPHRSPCLPSLVPQRGNTPGRPRCHLVPPSAEPMRRHRGYR